MDQYLKKEPQNPGYIHRTQEERSRSQNKKPYSQRIKSSHPAFSSKKENLNQEVVSQDLKDKLKELSKDVNQNSASDIIEVSSVKIKKVNQNSQSFLNDFNLNVQVNNSLNSKKIYGDKNSIQTIQEQRNEETQNLFENQKKNNFLKNDQQILDSKLQNGNLNNQQNNPNVSKVTKQTAIKIRQRSNSPNILKAQGQIHGHQNRIISANLQSKAMAAAQNINDYKVIGQSNKKREFEDVTINSNEESISSIQQKEKFKQLQGIIKPISQLQKQNKKKYEDSALSSNNSSDTENNGDSIQDKRVKSISLTPGIVLHNQFNLKESQNTFDPFEATNNSNVTQKRKSIDSENKLPRINKLAAKQKETTLYNQLRESNQKNALELPSIIDHIKQNVNSCENLFKNRFKDKQGGFQGQFQKPSANQLNNIKETEMNYDFEGENPNTHEQFDKAIMKQIKVRNDNNQGFIIKKKRQVESAKKRDSTIPIQNKNKIRDDSAINKESPNQLFKYIRQSQHSEQRESANRRDSSISHKQNGASIQQFIQARNRIKSENNVMQNNSSSNYQDKSLKDDSENESFSTADRKKLKKLNQIQSYLKHKMDNQKQSQVIQNQVQNSSNNNNSLISNNSNNQNNPQKSQPHNKIQMQIQQQQLLQISKNQQQALSNQKQQINSLVDNHSDQKIAASPKQQDLQEPLNLPNQRVQQKGVIEVLDQALCKRKEDKISKSISQQIEKEIDKLNVLTSKSQNARDEQLKIQEELIKYNLKIKLNKMKVVDTVQENEQEENF